MRTPVEIQKQRYELEVRIAHTKLKWHNAQTVEEKDRLDLMLLDLTPSREVLQRFGWELYFAMKATYPEIDADTQVQHVPMAYTECGFDVPLSQEGPSVGEIKPHGRIMTVKIDPQRFKEWRTEERGSCIFVYVPETNTIYEALQI
jgi:hypothetical protein